MANICSTCLSQDRTLKRLDSLKKDETLKWLHADFLSPEQAMLCWECESDLNHADKFRRRAAEAQAVLKTGVLGDGQIKTLSTLCTTDAVEDSTYPKTGNILKQIRKNNVKINPKHRQMCHIGEIDVIKVDECDESSNIEDQIKNMIEFLNKDVTDTKKDYVKLFSIIEEVDPNVIETDIEPETYAEPIIELDDDEPLAKIQKLTNTLIEPLKKKNDIIVHNVLEPIIDLSEPDFDSNNFEPNNFDSNDFDVDMDDPNFNIMEPIIDITEPGSNQTDPISVDNMNSNNVQKPGWPVLTLDAPKVTNVNTNVPNRSKVHISPKIVPIPIQNLTNYDPNIKQKPFKSTFVSPELLKLQNQLNNLNAGKSPIAHPPVPAPKVTKLRLMQAQKNMEANYHRNKQSLFKQKQDVLKKISLIQKSADNSESPKVLAINPDVLKQAQSAIPVFKIPKNTELLKQAELLYQKRMNPGMQMYEEIRIYNPQKMQNSTSVNTVSADNSEGSDYIARPLKCEACLQRFATQAEFDEHREQFHSERAGIYICSICTLRFKKEELLKIHYMEHTDMDCAYECKICAFKHREKHIMEKHVRDTHELKKCQFCSKQFKTQEQLSDHVMKTHMSTKELRKAKSSKPTCEVCNKWFNWPAQLEKHMMYEHPETETRVPCPVPDLKSHVKRCPPPTNDIEGMCSQCNKQFPRINYHMQTQHPESNQEAYCKHCNLQFANKSRLSAHLKMSSAHHTPTKFMCEHCARSFPLASKLAEHVATVHENKPLYGCDQCDQSFPRKHKLRAHMKKEHKKKTRDHVCHECGAAFFDVHVLKAHINIHAPEKPFHCAHCEWKFSTRGAFITHLRGKHPEFVVPRTSIK